MKSLSASPPLPLTIFFDGACRLCRSEIDNLAARDGRGALVFVDCSAPSFSDDGMPHSRAEMMQSIQGRFGDGTWIRGVDVFVVAYEAADMPWLSRMLAHRWVKPMMVRLYPWIARHRYVLSAIGVPQLMHWFAARARQKHAAIQLAAARASDTSTSCAGNRVRSPNERDCA